MTNLTDAVFGAVTDPARPLLTYYNDATGERTELSTATLGNWAAKIANYLRDEVGLLPGDAVHVALPEHWQTAALLLGTWWAGGEVVADPTAAAGAIGVTVTGPDAVDDHPDAEELLVAGLDPFGMPVADLPPGVEDFAGTVRVHGDHFGPGPAAGAAVLDGRDEAQVRAAALAAASAAGISAGDRVLSTRPWHTADGIVTDFLAPLLVGASLIWVDRPDAAAADPSTLAGRAETEKATVVLN